MLKAHRRYIYCRFFVGLAIPIWWAACIADSATDFASFYALWTLPVALPAIFMIFNLTAFPFAYSIFGSLARTPEPTDRPRAVSRATSGQIGLLTASAPFFSWRLHTNGLAFSAHGIGSAFIPTANITRHKNRLFGGIVLWHDSPEVRNPIAIPASRVSKELQHLLGPSSGTST